MLLARDEHIPGQSLEANTILLHHGDRDVTCLAGLDVRHGTGLARVSAPDDLAGGAIHPFPRRLGCHSISPMSTPVFRDSRSSSTVPRSVISSRAAAKPQYPAI